MPKLKKKTIKTPKGRKAVVRVSRWFPPYIKKGKQWRTTLRYITKSTCGVYIIRSKQTKDILYVGYSGQKGGQLEKTLYRHFQSWEDKKQRRVTFASKTAYEVMLILHPNCQMNWQLEQYYIQTLKPKQKTRIEIPIEDIPFKATPNPLKQANEEWKQLEEEIPF